MPLTYTGRLVRPGGLEHPSLIDIAVSLSRQPRFGGHCRRWWSVLDHTLFCDELAKQDEPWFESQGGGNIRIAALLHDAHECITADVPTDVKTEDFREQQRVLDVVIHDAFFPGGRRVYLEYAWDASVRRLDRRALCAEAQVVGPPSEKQRILELFGVTEELWDDVALLKRLMSETPYFGAPPSILDPDLQAGVEEYLRRMVDLL